MTYPNLPYLFDEDVKLSETIGIMKYICKKWRPALLGRTPAEMGECEMLLAHCNAFKGVLNKHSY